MDATCEICLIRARPGNPVRTLTTLRGPLPAGAEHLTVCRRCLGHKQVSFWPATSTANRRILAGLKEHEEPGQGRYTYLADNEGIRLVRLRPVWVHEHGEGPLGSGIHHHHGR